MKAAELDLRELLHFDPHGGLLRFAGQRALLFDSVALGILRRELVELIGLAGARAVLTRFGYAHGWRTAETLKSACPWDDESEWRGAGARLHTLQGFVVAETARRSGVLSERPSSRRFGTSPTKRSSICFTSGAPRSPCAGR